MRYFEVHFQEQDAVYCCRQNPAGIFTKEHTSLRVIEHCFSLVEARVSEIVDY
jgi:hypothetical protein